MSIFFSRQCEYALSRQLSGIETERENDFNKRVGKEFGYTISFSRKNTTRLSI